VNKLFPKYFSIQIQLFIESNLIKIISFLVDYLIQWKLNDELGWL
jgi:hypothetical protein